MNFLDRSLERMARECKYLLDIYYRNQQSLKTAADASLTWSAWRNFWLGKLKTDLIYPINFKNNELFNRLDPQYEEICCD